MNNLIETIRIALPLVVEEWNTKKLGEFELLFEQSYKEFFLNKQTQEKTKIVSPIINVVFCRVMKTLSNNFSMDEGNGRDYSWTSNLAPIEIEGKITLSVGNSWTGNGYKKTDIHLLIRFEMDENGMIISYFSALVDMSKCISNWTAPTTKSNFSTLKFLKEDHEHIKVIHGEIIKSKKMYLDVNMVR